MASMARAWTRPRGPVALDRGRVVGIDPGLGVTGAMWSLEPATRGAFVVEAGVRSGRGGPGSRWAVALELIHQGVLEVLDAYPTTAVALEQVCTVRPSPTDGQGRVRWPTPGACIVLAAAMRAGRSPRVRPPRARIKKDADLERASALGTDAARDQDRAGPGHPARAARRRRRSCAVALCHYQIAQETGGPSRGSDPADRTSARPPVIVIFERSGVDPTAVIDDGLDVVGDRLDVRRGRAHGLVKGMGVGGQAVDQGGPGPGSRARRRGRRRGRPC